MTQTHATTPHHEEGETATDDFISEILPPWLKQASHADIRRLRECFAALNASREHLNLAKRHLVPPDSFAASLLGRELYGQLDMTVALRQARWLEVRRRFVVSPDVRLPSDEVIYFRMPALQRLMQNFQAGASYYVGSGLVAQDLQETVISDRLADVARMCRSVDAGQRYQALLGRVFNVATQGQLAADKRNGLGMATEIAALRGQLDDTCLPHLRRLVDNDVMPGSAVQAHPLLLRVLGQPVDGALAIALKDDAGHITGVVLYLPDDPVQPLRCCASWKALSETLAAALQAPSYQRYFSTLIRLRERAAFASLLAKRLGDPQPDIAAQGQAPAEDIFVSLAVQQVARIKDDARILLVPTADADHAASEARIAALEEAGLDLLDLASFFVPLVGGLLLGQLVVRTLDEVYEGAKDWSLGHQHEAMEHLLGVAETVVVTTVTAGVVVGVARGFTRGTFIDRLEPIELDSEQRRLWSNDLDAYRTLPEPENTTLQDNGLHTDGHRHWWRHRGASYEVWQPEEQAPWRLRHPEREQAYGPRLEHNGDSAWRLAYERPLEWEGETYLLTRLWPAAEQLSARRVSQILRVAGFDKDALRGLLVENRRLPVTLRDTLERFAVAQRVDAFFARLDVTEGLDAEGAWLAWCRDQLAASQPDDNALQRTLLADSALWRARLLEHFSRQYLASDELLPLLKRDFPGLPDAYALEVLEAVDSAQRQHMLDTSRLPLAVAEQARSALQTAKLTRMLEGLYLQDSHSNDTVELVFALLRRRARWPQAVNLQVQEGSDTGPVLARLYPQGGQRRLVVLVRRNGVYALYDDSGFELDTTVPEPCGLFEAVAAALPPLDAERLGWSGAQGGQRLRDDVQAWLPAARRELLPLAGLREIKPRFNPGQRLKDGRVGYPLSGRGNPRTFEEMNLRDRIRALYPAFDDSEVTTYLDILRARSGSSYAMLLEQEQSLQRMTHALNRWVHEPIPLRQRGRRRFVSDELRRCWQMQGDRLIDSGDQAVGMRLDLSGLKVHTLPDLPADTDFSHVHILNLSGMRLRELPANFLGCFPRVRRLTLDHNALERLPPGLHELNELRELRLRHNNIHMSAPAAGVLDNLRLHLLDLSYNPLGLISLHFAQASPLTDLHLRHCQLQNVPSGLQECGFLEIADLRDNQLSSLPQAILAAPSDLRRSLLLDGNPLPAAVRQIMLMPGIERVSATLQNAGWSRAMWFETLEEEQRLQRQKVWDDLRVEAHSGDFFDILDRLTETSDYRSASTKLRDRVGEVLEALHADSELRADVFSLAASPRTCVDSVASCFSALEVRVLIARTLRGGAGQGRQARLELARRLFRLDQVEQFARSDIAARIAAGEAVDEVEVSLAYRTGLAQRLELPGQPQTMQFEMLAGVGAAQLEEAAAAVQLAEQSDALAEDVAQRDFWRECLKGKHGTRFEALEQPFWERLEALALQQDSLEEGVYLQRINALARERQAALDELFLTLTRQALAAQGQGGR
ncbi:hypothetical protein PS627_04147 [Pseudomonas fluorescens]|uniref:NEL-type E3 ubiquitin ligase domain-containing protein n=1 Tax=Pseudomonas fluorescens TaxID=294 RepID=UPI00125A519A|nr:NEL-type E3 ubiquitin ligase domain-containing protein [Pseudomonas fluorescens]CAG8870766.1 hypothetical protein PS627_04147 [Pseudomonas fluorescens]VVQ05320.1 hypothetical protein PS910_04238 [Pseudomonas fluorescens]